MKVAGGSCLLVLRLNDVTEREYVILCVCVWYVLLLKRKDKRNITKLKTP